MTARGGSLSIVPVRGFTLIELMISMLLGLVVIGGATGVILANRQSYRTNEGLSQVQESARTALELLARDVRQAGVTGCDSSGRVASVVVSDTGTPWWRPWLGIHGNDGAQVHGGVGRGSSLPPNRVEGTDSLLVQGIEGTGLSIVSHQPAAATFRLDTATSAISSGDILMVCDFDHAAIFQVTNYNSSSVTVAYDADNGGSLWNCSEGLGYPTDCTSANGNPYTFEPNSQIARMTAADWYIGNNGRVAEGGRSLYRRRMGGDSEEIVTGVTDMQVWYREAGRSDFRDASAVTASGSWSNVNAVMIRLTVQSAEQRVTTDTRVDSGRLQRQFTSIITLRNRVP